MQISILDPTKIKVEVLLGCPSRAFGSADLHNVSFCPSSRFIDAVITPWGAGPWAIQSPSWDAVLKSLATSSGGGVSCGMQVSPLDPDSVEVEVKLGCASRAFRSTLPSQDVSCPSGRFVDAVLSPWAAGPWAVQSPSWDSFHKALSSSSMATPAPGYGALLLGEPLAIEQFVKSVSVRAGAPVCVELDLSRAVHSYSISMLTGSDVGYIGYSPEGSEFSKAFAAAVEATRPFSGREESPCPVLIFHNIHRASPEVQHLVAEITRNKALTLPSGKKVQAPTLLVVATAPGLYPSSPNPSDTQRFIASATKGSRLIFEPSIGTALCPLVLPNPDFSKIVSTASLIIGNMWSHQLPVGAFVHPRVFAGPRLTSRVLSSAKLDESETALANVESKIKDAALSAIKSTPNAPLPESLVVPTRWGIMLEEEEGQLWAEPCPSEEIANHLMRVTLSTSAALALRVPLPLELLWNAPAPKSFLEKHVLGQDKVIEDITKKIALFKAAPRGNKPLLSALLLGTTGTGKTHLAKTMASAYGKPLVKVDCSTLQDNELLQESLFGMSQGSLASQLSVHPSAVVLLDEVDKAHGSIWFLLMQALDEGELRCDARPPINLRSHVFLATSNHLASELGVSFDKIAHRPMSEIESLLRSALFETQQINEACVERFDSVYFLPTLKGPAAQRLWGKVLLDEFGLSADEEILHHLARQYESVAASGGARGIKRACSEVVSSPSDWGMLITEGNLVRDPQAVILSRRQKLWKEACQSSVFATRAPSHWLSNALLDLLKVNSNKATPLRPQCLVMLAGPCSSGKAKIVKELSADMGKGDALVINCAHFTSSSALMENMFGSPSQSIPGKITTAAQVQPDRVILLTDIDRAPAGSVDTMLHHLASGEVQDLCTQQVIDLRHTAIFLTTSVLSEKMSELATAADKSEIPAAESCLKAEEAVLAASLLSPEALSLLDLVVPCATPEFSPASQVSIAIAREVTSEFGLPPDTAHEILNLLPTCSHLSHSEKQLRREMEKIASDLSDSPSRCSAESSLY
jgi:Ni2+-binding GTPase involved in maturation of urease and hydrogenase